ncbi:hypothetical protein [Ethanoligenens sp.]|uniref:hypothetical protein n=1 Tax=Ethanoligenens sp. TaxID=2099655 RepID=UPI0039E81F06
MVFQTIGAFFIVLGVLVVVLGIVIWKKQKLEWINPHYNVKFQDIGDFTRISGFSTIGMGFSMLISGVLWLSQLVGIGIIVFVICIALSLAMFIAAQIKYNK